MARRDRVDSTRPGVALSVAPDAVRIDTTGRSVDAWWTRSSPWPRRRSWSGPSSGPRLLLDGRLQPQPGLVRRGPGGGRRWSAGPTGGSRSGAGSTSPAVRAVRDRPGAPLQYRHPAGWLPDPASDPVHGQGQPVEVPLERGPVLLARRLSGPPRHAGPRGPSHLRGGAAGGRAGRAVPRGRPSVRPEVQPLFEGAAFVAARAGVPIVPVGIGGSEWAMPKGKRRILPVKVVMVVGPPIEPPDRAEQPGIPAGRGRALGAAARASCRRSSTRP